MSFLDTLLGAPGSDQSQALGLLAAGLMRGDAGGGFLAANQHFAGAPERRLKRSLLESQITENQWQAEDRKAAAAERARKAAFIEKFFGNNAPSQPASPGQLGSGSLGIVDAPAGQPTIPPAQQGGRLARMSADDLAVLKLNGVDLTEPWKLANVPTSMPAGGYSMLPGRQPQYMPDPVKGVTMGPNGSVGLMPNFLNTQAQLTMATEAPKALFGAAGKINLRDNPDGTKRPVSELSENPDIQALVRNVLGIGQVTAEPRPQAPQPRQSAPAGPAAPSANQIAPNEQKSRDAEAIQILQSEVNAEKNPQTKAALQRELDRMTASQSQPGFPTPTLKVSPNAQPAQSGMGYGKTTAQQIQEEADKARAVKQASEDVVPTAQRQSALASADTMLDTLNKAIKHPGLSTATGLSGMLDPRNYVPGTDAKDFRVLMDQLGGKTFLQAYESLKGGGAITTIEGDKATNAIARLNTAQSTEAFKEALGDLRDVVIAGRARMQGAGSDPKPATEPSKTTPTPPTVGMVKNGYRFKGGNPADQNSWEKQ